MIQIRKLPDWTEKIWSWGRRDPLVAIPVSCGLFFMLIAVIAIFFGKQEAARNIIYVAVAFGGACGLILTLRRTEALTRQANTAERNLVVERFTRAVGQLGDENNLTVRIGGIYSLEMIARTSEEERDAAIQTMAAFVRNRSPNTMSDVNADEKPKKLDDQKQEQWRSERLDVEITIHVLARLVKMEERAGLIINLNRANLACLDLSRCDLSFLNFGKANFSHASLFGVDFSHAFLFGSKLNYAALRDVNFHDTELGDANFYEAIGLDENSLIDITYPSDCKPRNVPKNIQLPPPITND